MLPDPVQPSILAAWAAVAPAAASAPALTPAANSTRPILLMDVLPLDGGPARRTPDRPGFGSTAYARDGLPSSANRARLARQANWPRSSCSTGRGTSVSVTAPASTRTLAPSGI